MLCTLVIDARIVKLINSVGLLNEARSLHAQLQPVANAFIWTDCGLTMPQ